MAWTIADDISRLFDGSLLGVGRIRAEEGGQQQDYLSHYAFLMVMILLLHSVRWSKKAFIS